MPQPTRVRRAPNRNPTSLALLVPNPIIEPSTNLSCRIDPQLTSLDIETALNDIAVAISYSPFSNTILSRSLRLDIPSPTLGLAQSDSIELFACNSQQPILIIEGLVL